MRFDLKHKVICLGLASMLVTACGKKDEEADEEETAGGVSSTGGSSSSTKSLSTASSVADFSLSSAFNLNLGALDGGSSATALALLVGKQSQEACMMGSTIKEVTSRLGEIGSFFCHMEVEKDVIRFGRKYKIVFAGEEFGRVYIDNSKIAEGKIELGFCGSGGGGTHKQLITIDGLTDAGPKGSVVDTGSYSEAGVSQAWAGSITFDGTTAGTMVLSAKQKYTSDANIFRRGVELKLVEGGVSLGTLASNGTWQGNSFQERGAAKFDGTYGSALFANSGAHEGQTFTFTRRAHFDGNGLTVATDASPDFVAGGDLHIASTDVPSFLADDFAPDSPAGWVATDCADTEEDLTLNPDSAAHQACDGTRSDTHRDCWDQTTFESGAEDAL